MSHQDAIQETMQSAVRHHQARRLSQAEHLYREILAERPDYAPALHYLGVIAHQTGRIDEAIFLMRRAIALNPNDAEASSNLGLALKAKGHVSDAIDAYRSAIAIAPNFPDVYNNLGAALKETGRFDEAIAAFRRSVALRPNFADAWNNLGATLRASGRLDEAIDAYRRAIAMRPDHVEAYCNLGNALIDKRQLDEAIAAFRNAIAINPNLPELHNNLGNALKDQGRLDDARVAFERAVALAPDNPTLLSNLVMFRYYIPGHSAEEIYLEQQLWNQRHAQPLARSIGPHSNNPDPHRRLRIGYISPDLSAHAISRYLLPVIENHDRSRHEVFCYSDVRLPDSMTNQFREKSDVWRNIVGFSDSEVAELVRKDAVDILIDLAMHTAHNRLMVFARKPAPVQVTWLAMPGGTGLDAIDYRMTDDILDPIPPARGEVSPSAESVVYVEKSVRLPNCWVATVP